MSKEELRDPLMKDNSGIDDYVPVTTAVVVDEDAAEQGRKKHLASTFRTAINITKCFVGAASFELPWAFAEAGAAGGVIGVVVLAILSTFSLQKLARCSSLVLEQRLAAKQATGIMPTYPDVGRAAFGPFGGFLAWFGVVAMSLGVCGSYLVFICSSLTYLTGWGSQTIWVLLILPLICVLSWVRHVSTFAWTSSFGVFALVAAVIIATVDAAQNGHNVTIDWTNEDPDGNYTMPLFKLETYPLFLGNAGYLYLISTAILPVSQSMSKPKEFQRAFVPSVLFVTVVNVLFGVYAAVRYGGHVCPTGYNQTNVTLINCVESNVLSNMVPGILAQVVQWLLVIDLIFTTIVFLFPLNEAIENAVLARLSKPAPGIANFWASMHTWAVNGLRTLVAIAIAAVALGIPIFSLLTGLTGGFGNNILGFILPPLFYFKLRGSDYWKDQQFRCRRVCEGISLVVTFSFGLVFLVLTLWSFTVALLNQ